MSAYTAPWVTPATISVTNRFQSIGGGVLYIQKKGRGRIGGRAPGLVRLLNRLVLAVHDLEDVELRAGQIAVRREANRGAEDRRGQPDRPEVLAELRPRDLVILAG